MLERVCIWTPDSSLSYKMEKKDIKTLLCVCVCVEIKTLLDKKDSEEKKNFD
mgnify:CR=1 FL=1